MSLREYLGFLRRAWGLFRGARKTWRLPPRARLLIIDRNTAYPLDEIFAHHSPHIMDIRGESINLAVVVRALPKFRLGALAYLEAYIDAVAPVLVLSRTDNNPMLWQLKRRPSVAYTVALVQNGWRLDLEFEIPVLLVPSGPHGPWCVDRVFSIGPTWAAQVHRCVPASGIPVGSVLLNTITGGCRSVTGIALVSTFRPKYPRRGLDLGESLYEGLGAYMRRHQLHLNVAGFAGPDGRGEEVAFLSARLPDGLWSLRSRESRLSSYETLLTAGTVIVDQSTLGYEALVLGKRVGFVGAMEWCR
jgi:surface carbohydrate biosynthesis protein